MKKEEGKMKKRVLFMITGFAIALAFANMAFAEVKMIDNFEQSGQNLLGGRCSVYQQEPSRVLFKKEQMERNLKQDSALMIKYDKKSEGGPYGSGGWCGYYTIVKTGNLYLDASPYKNLTFWVKGAKGDENFKVGFADRHWDSIGDSVKTEQIGAYIKAGKITTEWQKATIPLNSVFIDMKELASISICFEGDCFPNGAGSGTVYIDDITLE